MLSIEDVRRAVEEDVDLKVDGIAFRWNVSTAYESTGELSKLQTLTAAPIGYFIQIMYLEPDIEDPTGKPQLQQGRKWFVGKDVTISEVYQTCLSAALASAEHRTREWFLVKGQRIYGPHMDADRLVQMLDHEDHVDAVVEFINRPRTKSDLDA